MTSGPLLPDKCDVAIIGAGPAGLAAATIAGKAGLSTLMLDENAQPGGQIFRSITSTPVQRREILDDDYWRGEELVAEARVSGATVIHDATVWGLDRDLNIAVSVGGQSQLLSARRVILATGALERPFPIPGWTLPGVMTIGAAQTLLKSSGLIPDGKVVLAGTGPLLWLFAAQVLRAGGAIEAILDTTPRINFARGLPGLPAFLLSSYFGKGLELIREVKRKVTIVSNVISLAAVGEDRVNEVVATSADGGVRRIAVGMLLLHQGVVPNVNLAMTAGAVHSWNDRQLCWVPVIDADGNSTVKDIAIVGDGAGIGGAVAAVERGRLAALAVVEALAPERKSTRADRSEALRALRRIKRGRAFLDALFRPAPQFRRPQGDTIVCRCEEVTAVQIVETVALGAEGPNQIKTFLRCGMGACQGRFCGLTVTELIAQARDIAPEAVGYYRLRPPIKPVPLKELAAMPQTEQAMNAVVRG
jgi:NADPH-dependent 2,4-dienoyl-CoA reductase/sulfur reductase-like enzyme